MAYIAVYSLYRPIWAYIGCIRLYTAIWLIWLYGCICYICHIAHIALRRTSWSTAADKGWFPIQLRRKRVFHIHARARVRAHARVQKACVWRLEYACGCVLTYTRAYVPMVSSESSLVLLVL